MSQHTKPPLVDPGCFELACSFLRAEPNTDVTANRWSLAEAIQTAVEDWFKSRKDAPPGDDRPMRVSGAAR